MQIFIRRNNDQRGPFDLFTIQQGIDAGKILPTDSAWYEGAASWVFVSQIPGIRINTPASPPPMAPPPIPPVTPYNPAPYNAAPYNPAPYNPAPGYGNAPAPAQSIKVGCLSMLGAIFGVAIVYFLIAIVVVAIVGETGGFIVMSLAVLGSLVWVYFDATTLDTGNREVEGFSKMPPWQWALACFVIWMLVFPIYLAYRNALLQADRQSLYR